MLNNREELIALRNSAKARMDAEQKRIIVCAGAGCVCRLYYLGIPQKAHGVHKL